MSGPVRKLLISLQKLIPSVRRFPEAQKDIGVALGEKLDSINEKMAVLATGLLEQTESSSATRSEILAQTQSMSAFRSEILAHTESLPAFRLEVAQSTTATTMELLGELRVIRRMIRRVEEELNGERGEVGRSNEDEVGQYLEQEDFFF